MANARYAKLKKQWCRLLAKGKALLPPDCWIETRALPDQFYLFYLEGGNGTLGGFEDPSNALAYLRFCEVPNILSWDGTDSAEGTAKEAEEYLEKYTGAEKTRLQRLLASLDALIGKAKQKPAELTSLFTEYRRALYTPTFKTAVVAWGDLCHLLGSSFFKSFFAEAIRFEKSAAWSGNFRSTTELKRYVDAGTLDGSDPFHQHFAFTFIKRVLHRLYNTS